MGYERRVKRLFLAVVVLFSLQYWFAVRVTEPYPALMLPAFSGAQVDAEGRLFIDLAEVVFHFADGSSQPVTMRTLFARFPPGQFQAMANTALRPKPRRGPAPQNPWEDSGWKKHIPWTLFPGYVLRKRRTLYWDGVEPATMAWIRERARELFPEKTTVRFTVSWYRENFRWQDGRASRERALTVSVEEDL